MKNFSEKEILARFQSAWKEMYEFSKLGIITKDQAKQRRIAVIQVAEYFKLATKFVNYEE